MTWFIQAAEGAGVVLLTRVALRRLVEPIVQYVVVIAIAVSRDYVEIRLTIPTGGVLSVECNVGLMTRL